MDQMDGLLGLLATVFLMFLVLAAAVEVILESMRGMLERIGLKWVRGKISLEEALNLANEFSSGNAMLSVKVQAIKSAAQQISKKADAEIKQLASLQCKLQDSSLLAESLVAEVNDVAMRVKNGLEEDNHRRIFWLRLFAAAIGCLLTYQTHFYVLDILSQANEPRVFAPNLPPLNHEWVNILVGGLAAAAGSSYWHDQLDKVRNLKAVVQETRKLVE